MYPYNYEDVAWQRLQDVQREMENSRWIARGYRPAWIGPILWVGAKAAASAAYVSRIISSSPTEFAADAERCEAETDAA